MNKKYNLPLENNDFKEIVVGIHGFAGDKESSVLVSLEKVLSKQGIALLTFDLANHGQKATGDLLSLENCNNCVTEAFDYAFSFNVPVSVFATSFGAYLALNYIQKNNPFLKHIILRAPAVYMDQTFENVILPEHGFNTLDLNKPIDLGYNSHIFVDKKFLNDLRQNNLSKLDFKKTHIDIIQGKKDNVVDWKQNEKFLCI